MSTHTYEQLILQGIKGLPPEVLGEITDFVYFVRRRALDADVFEDELRNALLNVELQQLSQSEEAHLEREFEDYDQLHPAE